MCLFKNVAIPVILKLALCNIVSYVIYEVISCQLYDTIVLHLALFVYTTLWKENILVLNSRIVAANETLWPREMNLRCMSIILCHILILK